MDNFEKFLYQVKEGVETATKVVAQKSGELVNLTKIKYELGAEQTALDGLYKQIGMAVCELKKDNGSTEDVSKTIDEMCKEVFIHLEKIEAMNIEIAKMKNNKVCENCKKVNDNAASFCNNCGAALNENDVIKPDVTEASDEEN